jgi:hypothetical protein
MPAAMHEAAHVAHCTDAWTTRIDRVLTSAPQKSHSISSSIFFLFFLSPSLFSFRFRNTGLAFDAPEARVKTRGRGKSGAGFLRSPNEDFS